MFISLNIIFKSIKLNRIQSNTNNPQPIIEERQRLKKFGKKYLKILYRCVARSDVGITNIIIKTSGLKIISLILVFFIIKYKFKVAEIVKQPPIP